MGSACGQEISQNLAINPRRDQFEETKTLQMGSHFLHKRDEELSYYHEPREVLKDKQERKFFKVSEPEEEAESEKKKKQQFERSLPSYVLVRTWWFYTADWPPPKHDFDAELKKISLREVELEAWDTAPELDFQKRRKVFAVPLHRGLFQDSQGRILDLKPRENCEIYQILIRKSFSELLKLYKKALGKDLEDFKKKLDQISKEANFPTESIISWADSDDESSEESNSTSQSPLFRTWWFWCLEWPKDSDCDFQDRLRILNWRVIRLDNWETAPFRDENRHIKAFEVPFHPKVFENAFASLVNCKPKGIVDHYEELKSKSFFELLKLYAIAMEKEFCKFR